MTLLWFCEFLGEDGEEVFVEGFGDLEEEVGVEAFALEDVIYVGAFATDFAGKPWGGTLLCLKFLLDEFAYMYHKKNVELLLLVSTTKGSRIAHQSQRSSNTEAHVDMNILPNALRELSHKVSDRNIHTTKTSILLSPLTLIMNLRDS